MVDGDRLCRRRQPWADLPYTALPSSTRPATMGTAPNEMIASSPQVQPGRLEVQRDERRLGPRRGDRNQRDWPPRAGGLSPPRQAVLGGQGVLRARMIAERLLQRAPRQRPERRRVDEVVAAAGPTASTRPGARGARATAPGTPPRAPPQSPGRSCPRRPRRASRPSVRLSRMPAPIAYDAREVRHQRDAPVLHVERAGVLALALPPPGRGRTPSAGSRSSARRARCRRNSGRAGAVRITPSRARSTSSGPATRR